MEQVRQGERAPPQASSAVGRLMCSSTGLCREEGGGEWVWLAPSSTERAYGLERSVEGRRRQGRFPWDLTVNVRNERQVLNPIGRRLASLIAAFVILRHNHKKKNQYASLWKRVSS